MSRPSTRMPPLDVVLRTVGALQEHGIVVALGGSGLLAAFGLVDQVRDWDLSTDAERDSVAAALSSAGIDHVQAAAGDGHYATQARFRIEGDDHEVDLLIGFALRSGGSRIAIPTRVTGYWRGLPLGDPAQWALAYRLMGRDERATPLQTWLDTH